MASNKLWKDGEGSEFQEILISPADRKRKSKKGQYKYIRSYAHVAYKLLSASRTAKTRAHVCKALCIGMKTFHRWEKAFPEFKAAIEDGLTIGEARWRERLATWAFKPAGQVNIGIIKILSSNVYGLKDDPETVIINTNNNTNNQDTDKMMKDRGIPVPNIGIDDI